MVYQKQQLRYQGNLLSRETNLCLDIATGVISSFSRHKLFKAKFTWKSQYILSLDYINVQKVSQIHPLRPPAVASLTSCPTERGNSGECVSCAWSNVITHSVTPAVQRGKNGNIMARNFCFWRPYIALYVDTYCVILVCIGHKWNLSVWSYKIVR
jgi:hypothetical protein